MKKIMFLSFIVIVFIVVVYSIKISNTRNKPIPQIPNKTIIPKSETSVTPAKDSRKSCTDGSQCSVGWCIENKCSAKLINPFGIGDYAPTIFTVNGKSFPVIGYGTYLVIEGNDSDSELQSLKTKLCKNIKCMIIPSKN